MTENQIQRARDVLAKWRADGSEFKLQGGLVPLIAGLGGNPDLLDAIDDMLKHTAIMSTNSTYAFSTFGRLAERISAAIIAADERMSA